jgi:DNA-binding HxlR family transcriptional regulator
MSKKKRIYRGQVHAFSVDLCLAIGFEETILLQHIDYWRINNAEKEFYNRDGYTWTYNSLSELQNLFPYINRTKIVRSMAKLESLGLIVKGNYNKFAYDKTTWYAITEKGLALFETREMVQSDDEMVQSEPSAVQNDDEMVQSEPSAVQNETAIPYLDSNLEPDSDKNITGQSYHVISSELPREKEQDHYEENMLDAVYQLENQDESPVRTHATRVSSDRAKHEAGSTSESSFLDQEVEPNAVSQTSEALYPVTIDSHYFLHLKVAKVGSRPATDQDWNVIKCKVHCSNMPNLTSLNLKKLVHHFRHSTEICKKLYREQRLVVGSVAVLFTDRLGRHVLSEFTS